MEKTKFGRSFESWRVWCSVLHPSLAWRSSSTDSMSFLASPISSSRWRSKRYVIVVAAGLLGARMLERRRRYAMTWRPRRSSDGGRLTTADPSATLAPADGSERNHSARRTQCPTSRSAC